LTSSLDATVDFLFSAMFPSHSSESDEDYRPDAKEEAMLSMYEDTAVKDESFA